MAEVETIVKKTRARKVVNATQPTVTNLTQTTPGTSTIVELFSELSKKISQSLVEFERLQKEIAETKQAWAKDQEDHKREAEERDHQEELQRQREKETYSYELVREHKKAADEFADKKASWERQLQEQKEAIEKDRVELEELRKLVSNFEEEKEKSIKDSQIILQKELTEKFEYEKKLREQEIKAEKEISNLRIAALSTENSKQSQEIENLKRALDEATRQVKDIAVKVIESGSNTIKNPPLSEN